MATSKESDSNVDSDLSKVPCDSKEMELLPHNITNIEMDTKEEAPHTSNPALAADPAGLQASGHSQTGLTPQADQATVLQKKPNDKSKETASCWQSPHCNTQSEIQVTLTNKEQNELANSSAEELDKSSGENTQSDSKFGDPCPPGKNSHGDSTQVSEKSDSGISDALVGQYPRPHSHQRNPVIATAANSSVLPHPRPLCPVSDKHFSGRCPSTASHANAERPEILCKLDPKHDLRSPPGRKQYEPSNGADTAVKQFGTHQTSFKSETENGAAISKSPAANEIQKNSNTNGKVTGGERTGQSDRKAPNTLKAGEGVDRGDNVAGSGGPQNRQNTKEMKTMPSENGLPETRLSSVISNEESAHRSAIEEVSSVAGNHVNSSSLKIETTARNSSDDTPSARQTDTALRIDYFQEELELPENFTIKSSAGQVQVMNQSAHSSSATGRQACQQSAPAQPLMRDIAKENQCDVTAEKLEVSVELHINVTGGEPSDAAKEKNCTALEKEPPEVMEREQNNVRLAERSDITGTKESENRIQEAELYDVARASQPCLAKEEQSGAGEEQTLPNLQSLPVTELQSSERAPTHAQTALLSTLSPTEQDLSQHKTLPILSSPTERQASQETLLPLVSSLQEQNYQQTPLSQSFPVTVQSSHPNSPGMSEQASASKTICMAEEASSVQPSCSQDSVRDDPSLSQPTSACQPTSCKDHGIYADLQPAHRTEQQLHQQLPLEPVGFPVPSTSEMQSLQSCSVTDQDTSLELRSSQSSSPIVTLSVSQEHLSQPSASGCRQNLSDPTQQLPQTQTQTALQGPQTSVSVRRRRTRGHTRIPSDLGIVFRQPVVLTSCQPIMGRDTDRRLNIRGGHRLNLPEAAVSLRLYDHYVDLGAGAVDMGDGTDLPQQFEPLREIRGATDLRVFEEGGELGAVGMAAENEGLPQHLRNVLDRPLMDELSREFRWGRTYDVIQCLICHVRPVNVQTFNCQHRVLCLICLLGNGNPVRVLRVCPLRSCRQHIGFYWRFGFE